MKMKRRKMIVLLLLFCIIFPFVYISRTVEADEEYKSNGNIGFHGVYKYPEESNSQSINEQSRRTTASKIDKESVQETGRSPSTKEFPKTGDNKRQSIVIFGLVLTLVAIIIYFKKESVGKRNGK